MKLARSRTCARLSKSPPLLFCSILTTPGWVGVHPFGSRGTTLTSAEKAFGFEAIALIRATKTSTALGVSPVAGCCLLAL